MAVDSASLVSVLNHLHDGDSVTLIACAFDVCVPVVGIVAGGIERVLVVVSFALLFIFFFIKLLLALVVVFRLILLLKVHLVAGHSLGTNSTVWVRKVDVFGEFVLKISQVALLVEHAFNVLGAELLLALLLVVDQVLDEDHIVAKLALANRLLLLIYRVATARLQVNPSLPLVILLLSQGCLLVVTEIRGQSRLKLRGRS